MPRGDKTGPEGLGPMTGRRMGYCTGNNNPGFDWGFGRRMSFGRGMRSGFGRRFNQGYGRSQGRILNIEDQNLSKKEVIENELGILKSQMEYLESELKKLD